MGGASIPMAGRCRCVDALWCVDADGRSVDPDGSDGCVDAGVGPDWRCVDALWRVDADGRSVDPDGSDGCVDADGRSVHPDGLGSDGASMPYGASMPMQSTPFIDHQQLT